MGGGHYADLDDVPMRGHFKPAKPLDGPHLRTYYDGRWAAMFGLFTFSSAWYAAYCFPLRRKEWVDILLDYVHHKRTNYAPGMLEKAAQTVTKGLRYMPK